LQGQHALQAQFLECGVNTGVAAGVVAGVALRHTLQVSKLLADRFDASPQAIKRQIEALIERSYMSRSEEDRHVYHYVA
jgi:hypothetical protein